MMKNIAITAACALVLGLSAGCAKLNPNTQSQIQSALEAKQGEFKQCYESALQRNRDVQGHVGLKLQIEKDKKTISKAEIEKSEIKDKEMKDCVAGAAKSIELPEPPGVPVEGHYAVDFSFE